MFYNIFTQKVTASVYNNVDAFIIPAASIVGLNPSAIVKLVTTLTAGPFQEYAYLFNITSQAQIDQIVQGGHEVYKVCFSEIYLISIAFGGAATISFFFLTDIRQFINEHVAVNL